MSTAQPGAPSGDRTWRPLGVAAVVVAGAGQLVVGWLTSATGLLAPLWAIVALGVLWLAGVAVLIRVARWRPLATLLVPAANLLLLWAAVAAGDAWLGWTA